VREKQNKRLKTEEHKTRFGRPSAVSASSRSLSALLQKMGALQKRQNHPTTEVFDLRTSLLVLNLTRLLLL